MKKNKDLTEQSDLRRRAEKALEKKSGQRKNISIMSQEDIERMVHDLEVHQIELEMQNDEQIRTHHELEKARDAYISLYDFAPVGYFTVSEKGMVEEANLFAADMLGVERREILGKPFTHFILKQDQDIFYMHRQQLFKNEAPQSCELILLKKDGSEFYAILKSIVVATVDRGQIRTAVSDISEIKRLELALRKKTEELEIHMEKLEQRNRDLAEFVHVASHDLQEPARKIQTFSDRLLAESPDLPDGAMRDSLVKIQKSASRLRLLLSDLLLYSRLTEKPPPFTRFNVKDVVQEAIIDLSLLLEESGGSVEIGELPEIVADRGRMAQLFLNLIGNALKYRGERKPVIRISDHSITDQIREIHVQDNSIGFDERYLEMIFKPFQRLHSQQSTYKGTGMGLSICRRIVEEHGGTITAKSKPGKGSVFIVRLPGKADRQGKKIAP